MASSREKRLSFSDGLRDGLPIGLGYFPVSFGFGILALSGGVPALGAFLISALNLTSAGQVAGLSFITAAGALTELALSQLIINLRYSLMGISLSQRLSPRFTLPHRLLASAFITDEVYAVASSRREPLEPAYWYGLACPPYLGWTAGTLSGALAGDLLPDALTGALGIAIYGMFLAMLLPPAREDRAVLFTVLCAALLSSAVALIPLFSFLASGLGVILCAVLAAAAAALCFPRAETPEGEEAGRA
ncbi:MAG: AzlC family ABC transporter permease [Clostridia bacterium]|nr:AzlC family ABC transporter permease [Clostridia bacterium]